jgi:hypothetical protein
MRFLSFAWVAIGVLLAALPASAQPRVHVTAEGDCPSTRALTHFVSPWVMLVEQASGAWSVRVEPTADGARLVLRAPDGSPSVTRAIASEDCAALARAFAFVVHGRFVELEMIPPERPEVLRMPERPELPVQPERPEQPEPRVGEADERHLDPSEPESDPSDPDPETETETETEPEPEPRVGEADERHLDGIDPPTDPSSPDPRRRLLFAVLGGARVTADPVLGAAFVQVDAGYFITSAFSLRLAADIATPSTQGPTDERVEVLRSLTQLQAGLRFDGGTLWLEPRAGFGLAIIRVEALDLPGRPSALRVQPTLVLGLGLGLTLGAGFSLRADLTGTGVLLGHSYRVDPAGEVAQTPAAGFMLGLGLQADLDW